MDMLAKNAVIYRLMALYSRGERIDEPFNINSETIFLFYLTTLEECESHIARLSAKQEISCFVVDTIPMGVNIYETPVKRWVQFRDGNRYNVPCHNMYNESDFEEQRAIARIRERICGSTPKYPFYINNGKR